MLHILVLFCPRWRPRDHHFWKLGNDIYCQGNVFHSACNTHSATSPGTSISCDCTESSTQWDGREIIRSRQSGDEESRYGFSTSTRHGNTFFQEEWISCVTTPLEGSRKTIANEQGLRSYRSTSGVDEQHTQTSPQQDQLVGSITRWVSVRISRAGLSMLWATASFTSFLYAR